MPKRHSAIDKALGWRTGSRGLNSNKTKVYSAPILLGTPARVNNFHGGGKKRGIMVKSLLSHL